MPHYKKNSPFTQALELSAITPEHSYSKNRFSFPIQERPKHLKDLPDRPTYDAVNADSPFRK